MKKILISVWICVVQELEEKLGERTRIIEADISQTFDFSNERSRRSTEKHSDKYKYRAYNVFTI
jgi:hypothetical protein